MERNLAWEDNALQGISLQRSWRNTLATGTFNDKKPIRSVSVPSQSRGDEKSRTQGLSYTSLVGLACDLHAVRMKAAWRGVLITLRARHKSQYMEMEYHTVRRSQMRWVWKEMRHGKGPRGLCSPTLVELSTSRWEPSRFEPRVVARRSHSVGRLRQPLGRECRWRSKQASHNGQTCR